jgi:glycosyltransferase involved in cell wall biosynthesis
LIATLGQRNDRFLELLAGLLPQVERAAGAVTVTALWNNGERPLAEVRQALVDHADGEYISFVDDDDQLPPYYVSAVLPLLDGVDYVGWRMQCIQDGVYLKPTFHSLRYSTWSDDDAGYYRDVSHLNPVRAELARRADYRRGEPPEDVSWADQMRGSLKTEHYIEHVMYVYRATGRDSTWQRGSVQVRPHVRPHVDHPYFSYHPESST